MIVLQMDNSGNHGAMAPDALVSSRLNYLKDSFPVISKLDKEEGIEASAFRDSKWTDSEGKVHEQKFTFNDGKDHKSVHSILVERQYISKESVPTARGMRRLQELNLFEKFTQRCKGLVILSYLI